MKTLATENASNEEIKAFINASLSFGTGVISSVKRECRESGYSEPCESLILKLFKEIMDEGGQTMTDYRTKTQEITAKINALRERVNQAEGHDKLELEAEITELMKKINQLLDESLKAKIP